MNERMIELANKANEQVGYKFKLEDAKQIHELMEKFAELIVRECANWMDDEKDENGDRISDSFYWSDRMKKHFGVEE